MRMLLVCVLSGSLIGCSCPCSYRTAAVPAIEFKPTPLKRDRTTKKVASKNVTKTADVATVAKPKPPEPSKGSDAMIPGSSAPSPPPTESLKSVVGTTMNAMASGQTSVAPDPVFEMAKTAVANKMENPASVEFENMTRAIRKDSFGQSVDTICGYVRGKKASGTDTGKRAFLYL